MKTLNNYILERLNPKNLGSIDILSEELKEKYKLIYNPATGRYDCTDNIRIKKELIKNGHFICNFGVARGRFDCSECDNLKTLKGAPKEVEGYFDCSNCKKLESLEGAPEKVGGFFDCSECDSLKSLEGAPKIVDRYFSCDKCKNLESLKGAPEEVGNNFYCSGCPKLTDYNINTKIGGKLYNENFK